MNNKPDVFGWHFAANDKKLGYNDGREIKGGVTHWVLDMDQGIQLCNYGLHASLMPLDALEYAPGSIISYCRMHGNVIYGDDKVVAEGREYLYVFDTDTILKEFSRWCALQVIHLWDAPEVVKQYLTTGDESLRAASEAALWAAAWDAARAAAWAASRDAAWAALRAASRAAAWDAARDASWAAARAASWDAAWDAARAASRAAQNAKLTEMLWAEINKKKEEVTK